MLYDLYQRYQRPIIITETSGQGDLRPGWVRDIGRQCLQAVETGVDLHGVCLHPIIDTFQWHDGSTPRAWDCGTCAGT